MQLSLHSDYALRVLMALVSAERQLSVDEIARRYGISRNHLAKVAQRLQSEGFVTTLRGRGGGMRGMRMTMCWWNSNWLCGARPNPPRGAPGVPAAGAASNNSSAAGREGFVMAGESTLSESV